jgi:chromosome segregation ATPase
MKDDKHNSKPVTRGELTAEFERFEGKMEQLLSDQANVLLGAVDERMSTMLETMDERIDKKLNEKIDPVITKLDSILKGVEDLKDENAAGAAQLRRHEDRISALEVRLQRSP